MAGLAPTLSSELKGEVSRDPGCGLPGQKVSCLRLSKSAMAIPFMSSERRSRTDSTNRKVEYYSQ